jgi:hypothetical protein
VSQNNGSKPDNCEEQIREAVSRLACLILNEGMAPDRYCVVISLQQGSVARLAHHCSHDSGTLEEVAGGYSVVSAAAMHAGRMAVIESTPPDGLNLAVAQFFQQTQKHLANFEKSEQAKDGGRSTTVA